MPTSLVPLFGPLPGGPEMIVILLIVVLLFGANKLPKLARSSGQAMGEFKKGREEIEKELSEMRGSEEEFRPDDDDDDDLDSDDSFGSQGGFEQAGQRDQDQSSRQGNQRGGSQQNRGGGGQQNTGGGWGNTDTSRERSRR